MKEDTQEVTFLGHTFTPLDTYVASKVLWVTQRGTKRANDLTYLTVLHKLSSLLPSDIMQIAVRGSDGTLPLKFDDIISKRDELTSTVTLEKEDVKTTPNKGRSVRKSPQKAKAGTGRRRKTPAKKAT